MLVVTLLPRVFVLTAQVGYKRVVDLGKDGERTMITRAMRPLLFGMMYLNLN